MSRRTNKFDVMSHVVRTTLKADDKALLVELIIRSDDDWFSWPSVQRLCQVRGIKHEKNFKGVDAYLPGLVTKEKRGRKNTYTLNVPAIMALPLFEVHIKHTPPIEGMNTPASAANTPPTAENTPLVAGANTTSNTTKDTSQDNTTDCALHAPSGSNLADARSELSLIRIDPEDKGNPFTVGAPRRSGSSLIGPNFDESIESLLDTTTKEAPSLAGVSSRSAYPAADDLDWDAEW
jgi:hypothetical protein